MRLLGDPNHLGIILHVYQEYTPGLQDVNTPNNKPEEIHNNYFRAILMPRCATLVRLRPAHPIYRKRQENLGNERLRACGRMCACDRER